MGTQKTNNEFLDWEVGMPCILDGGVGFYYGGFDPSEGERFITRIDGSTSIRVFPIKKDDIINIKKSEVTTIYKEQNSTGPFYDTTGPWGLFFRGSELHQELDRIIRYSEANRR